MKPRMPNSPPAVPTIAISRTISGASVIVSAIAGIGDLALPHLLAGRFVEGEHAAVERDRNDLVLPERDAAVVDAAAGDVAGPGAVDLRIEPPSERAPLAAGHVDGVDAAPAVGDVHDAVFDDRRRFEVACL